MPEGSTTDITCLTCGYDLRMIERDRCPDGGEIIDRNAELVAAEI